MAVKPKPEALDANRIATIAQAIANECSGILGADQERTDAQDALNEAAEKSRGKRETIMVSLAAFSATNDLTHREIEVAVRNAIAGINDKSQKALSTFMGETKRAMHPLVREHVPALVDLRDAAWMGETEARAIDKEAAQPLKKAFARKYHFLSRLFGAAEEGVVYDSVGDIVAWAEALDPTLDPKKLLDRLKAIRKDLEDIFAEFPDDDIQASAQSIAEITEDHLKAARAARHPSKPETATVAQKKPDIKTVSKAFAVKSAPVAETTPETEVAEGASDVIAEIMGDDYADAV